MDWWNDGVIFISYSVIIQRLVFIHEMRTRYQGLKIIYVGTALYLFIHFVFNVGGVTGLIPLTGIPL